MTKKDEFRKLKGPGISFREFTESFVEGIPASEKKKIKNSANYCLGCGGYLGYPKGFCDRECYDEFQKRLKKLMRMAVPKKYALTGYTIIGRGDDMDVVRYLGMHIERFGDKYVITVDNDHAKRIEKATIEESLEHVKEILSKDKADNPK